MILYLLLGAPIAALIWFLVSLILFLKTPKDSEKRKSRRGILIASAVTAGAMLLTLAALFLLLLIALMNM